MKKCAFISMFLLLGSALLAQSLAELLERAKRENLELSVLDLDYKAALERAPQIAEWSDMELGVGLFPLPVETRLGAQLLRISGTQMLPKKGIYTGKTAIEIQKAKALYERQGIRSVSVEFEIKTAYFQLYELDKKQFILKQNLRILNALEQLALAKTESGKGSAADVLRVQIQREALQQELLILENKKAIPIAEINQRINRTTTTPILLSDSLAFAEMPLKKDSIVAMAAAQHPIFKMYAEQQKISEKAIELNKIGSRPMFGFGLDYILVNQRNDAEPPKNGRDIVQVRGMVKVPLSRDRFTAKEREERLKMDAIEQQKAHQLSLFAATIEKAYSSHETARLNMQLYARQIELTEATIRILESQYSSSGRGFDELIRLEKDLVDYELKRLKAIMQSHTAKAIIEQFTEL